ncbi:hypothetical protein ZEAMMB73_Zm00001d045140 [Zea mays]|uniref:Protein kinase superfamily protein n=1 Tax=Zea mays TaxID=4577 RepID=A0A1D6NTY6_MAIZE|nr:hypothetical protein ZEAMMB73_Zm00001d045140 [Zea mays]
MIRVPPPAPAPVHACPCARPVPVTHVAVPHAIDKRVRPESAFVPSFAPDPRSPWKASVVLASSLNPARSPWKGPPPPPRICVPAILRLGSAFASTLPARSSWKGPPPADLASTSPTSSPRISLAIHGSGLAPDSARVKGQYSTRVAQSVALVVYWCLSGSPKNRPDMSTIIQALEPLLDLDDDMPVAPLGHAGPVMLFVAATAEEKKERAPRKDVLGHRRRPLSPKASPRKHPSAGTKEEFWVWHLPADQKTRPSLGGVVQACA